MEEIRRLEQEIAEAKDWEDRVVTIGYERFAGNVDDGYISEIFIESEDEGSNREKEDTIHKEGEDEELKSDDDGDDDRFELYLSD